MRILLDTHCWLWSQLEPEMLSAKAQQLIASPANELFLSAASSWEIALKHEAGKLRLPSPPAEYVPSRMAEDDVTPLPVQHVHALRAGALPRHHRDPFDRLLVAQAEIEGLPLMTADARLLPYPIEVVWAGLEPPKRRRPAR